MTILEGGDKGGSDGGDSKGSDWISGLSPEHQAFIQTKAFKAPADVIQAYQHAEKLIGADKIVVPKDGVWDEGARAKLGIPADPTGYKYERPKLPEGLPYDEAFEKAALTKAHELGLTPKQVTELMNFYALSQGNAYATSTQEVERLREETVGTLKKEWGKAYDDKITHAARAAKQIGGDELVRYLEDSGAGDSPHLIRAFAKIGAMLAEDKLPPGSRPAGMNLTPDEARAEANKLMSSEAYRNRAHLEHAETVKRVQQLFQSAYPEG